MARNQRSSRHGIMLTNSIVFDLDGTLVDSLPGITMALNAALQREGLATHPEQAVRRFVGDGLEMTLRRACPRDTSDATIGMLVDDFRIAYAKVWKSGTRPYDGIPELLRDLQTLQIPLAVLSNKSHSFTVEMVAEIFSDIHFTHVLGLKPCMSPKPDPAGALEIVSAIGLRADQCTMIGDSTMDIQTAKNSGMRSCAVTWGYQQAHCLEIAAPDATMHDVPALRKYLGI